MSKKLNEFRRVNVGDRVYLAINRGSLNNEIVDRNDFIKLEGRSYYRAIVPTRVKAQRNLMAL